MKHQKKISVSRFIAELMQPYKLYFGIFLFVGLCSGVLNTFLPYTIKVIVDKIVGFQGDRILVFSIIQQNIFYYAMMWLGLCLNLRLLDWAKLKLYPRLQADSMMKMFSYLGQHSYHYLQNNFAGSFANKISEIHGGIVGIISIINDLYEKFWGLSIAFIMLLYIRPIFAFILLTWITSFLLITILFLKPIKQLSHVFAESRSVSMGRIVDSISNMAHVRLFSRHQFENEYIHQSIEDTVKKDRAMQKKIIWMRLLWDISIISLLALNLCMLGYLYSRNRVTIGDFSLVLALTVNIAWGIWFIAGQFVLFSEQIGSCEQALSIMKTKHGIVDSPNAKPLIVQRGEIEFQNVTFHYTEGAPLFENINIKIHAGEKVGLVGLSGAGKSTFVNLILRLFEVKSGTITIDHQNINDVTQNTLRANIALIPQDVSLFHRSLMENIRYGRIDATDEEVISAAKKANCHEFISTLKNGYQSMVGERGLKFSGGQRQRIAIARAILKNAPILILDEATSSLDSLTEQYIEDAMQKLMQKKTTLIIAHRLSTLTKMDRIL